MGNVIYARKETFKQENENFSNLCNGGQSRRRTITEMQGVNAPTTWLTKFTISEMDDNLDALVPLTIQWPKKSREKMENQQENKSNEKKLSSQGEDGLNNLQGRNHESKTHWPRSGVNPNLHLQASARLPNWKKAPEGGWHDCFSTYCADRHNCQRNKCAKRGRKDKNKKISKFGTKLATMNFKPKVVTKEK